MSPKGDPSKGNVLSRTWTEFSDDDCMSMSAALAYYTAFSLPPLLAIIVTVAGWIWSPEEVTSQLEAQISSVAGEGGWEQTEEMMKQAEEKKQGGWLATIVGFVVLLFGATGVMVQLQYALNKAWGIQPDPQAGGIKNFIMKRILSFAMILGIAFLLLVSLALTTILNAMGGQIEQWMPAGTAAWIPMAVNFVASFAVILLLFAAMFKWLPDAEIQWKQTWIGAAVTALLFMVGKYLLSWYFSATDAGAYGAVASFLLVLLWVYYSSIILLLGAEFTQVWARRHGAEIQPSQGAVSVETEKRYFSGGQGMPATR